MKNWVIVIGVALFGLEVGSAWAGTRPVATDDGCAQRCYQAKSTAYQRCRTKPPGDRAARRACFRQADQTLDACLKSCK